MVVHVRLQFASHRQSTAIDKDTAFSAAIDEFYHATNATCTSVFVHTCGALNGHEYTNNDAHRATNTPAPMQTQSRTHRCAFSEAHNSRRGPLTHSTPANKPMPEPKPMIRSSSRPGFAESHSPLTRKRLHTRSCTCGSLPLAIMKPRLVLLIARPPYRLEGTTSSDRVTATRGWRNAIEIELLEIWSLMKPYLAVGALSSVKGFSGWKISMRFQP